MVRLTIHLSLRIISSLRLGTVLKSKIDIKLSGSGSGLKRSRPSSRKYCSNATEYVPLENIRNFSIIAHIDHGKSTLADRLLEITGAISENRENQQVLDRLPVEKERGITVKAVAASLRYLHDGVNYQLNLIDTPGHVDFSNEVSRSLSACQGVILLVDANDGIQAQTVANYYLAKKKNLKILPVLNKIDLKNADPERVQGEINSLFDIDVSDISRISAKTGSGVEDLLKSIIEKVPPPNVRRDGPFDGLVIDAWYDTFRGSILFIYVKRGEVRVGDAITSRKTGLHYPVKWVGKLCPEEVEADVLRGGEVGVISCNMRNSKEAIVGDSLSAKGSEPSDSEGFEEPKPMVFAGLFPRSQTELASLRSALDKLLMNDPSVSVSLESSPALGSGWRLGFLGLLHLDVFRQRLEQEFEKETVLTAPSVQYKFKIVGAKNIKKYGGDMIEVRNPSHFPDSSIVKEMYEPVVSATIITPVEYMQSIIEECTSRRGKQKDNILNLSNNRVVLKFVLPLNEIILDFHDTLKRMTSGYATFDYETDGHVLSTLEKLTVLINGREVEELLTIVHSSRARATARKYVLKLKETIPRQQVAIAIQALVGGKVLAREDIKPYRKDVTAKLYGGDVTRKMKLLKQQREGKKKMRQFANIEIHRDTFIDVLREY